MKMNNEKEKLRDILSKSLKEIPDLEGSCTLAIVYLVPYTNKIRSLIMGDSSFCIIKVKENESKIIYKSKEQMIGYNCPKQCGHSSCDPYDSIEEIHEISNNDIIIVGTDGYENNIDFGTICLKKKFLIL